MWPKRTLFGTYHLPPPLPVQVSTLALKSISGVTHSVANTAKRAIIIVGCAIAFGESMAPIKMAGCSIAIAGTFFYAIADDIADMVGGKKKKKA